MRCLSTVDDQRHATAQLVNDVLSSRRTDPAETIRARRRQRRAERTNDFGKYRMRADPDRNSVESRRHDFRHDSFARQNNRQRSRPKFFGQDPKQLSIFVSKIDNFLQPIAIRKMNNEWIETWTTLRLKNFRDGSRIKSGRGESVNRFGRERDDFAFAQQFNRRVAVG